MNWLKKAKIDDPFEDPASFGNIAIELRYIKKEDLLEALKKQEARLPLGEILVGMGRLTAWQRDQILLEQEARRASTSDEKNFVELRRQRKIVQQMSTYLREATTISAEFNQAVTASAKK
jgi:hypothetical protein